MTTKVLFVSQTVGFKKNEKSHCGVGIRGKLLCDALLETCKTYTIIPCYVDNNKNLELAIQEHTPVVIIYNFHNGATPWLIDPTLRLKYENIKHVMIHYDVTQDMINEFTPKNRKYYMFDALLCDNDTLDATHNTSVFIMPRCLPVTTRELNTEKHDIPWIGYQGFGFETKGISQIAQHVVREFDEALIRLHMPCSYFMDPHGTRARQRVHEVQSIIVHKPGIHLNVSFEYKSDDELIYWLSENDVNCYFFDNLPGSGIASSPDYALAARKPIAIKQSHMLRHMWGLGINIEKHSLREIISKGITPLEGLYTRYKREYIGRDVEAMCDKLLSI